MADRHTPTPHAAALAMGLLLASGQASLADSFPNKPCPLVVPESQRLLQPRRIQPDQVQGKNAMGCLSPADAVYGADGCPLKLCGADAGVIQLPAP